MTLRVYGIPTCGSCKKALKWLEQEKIDFEWVDTRQNPPSRQAIEGWIGDLGTKVMRNTSGGAYRALGDEKNQWSDAQWAEAFSEDAMLLKRPLFDRDGKGLCTGFRNPDEVRDRLMA